MNVVFFLQQKDFKCMLRNKHSAGIQLVGDGVGVWVSNPILCFRVSNYKMLNRNDLIVAAAAAVRAATRILQNTQYDS